MRLIFKYLKPYFLTVLVIIGLTYAQVQTELKLPDYMSVIVTNGIQYSGITETIPKAINKDDMEHILSFSSDDELIFDEYVLVNKGQKSIIDNTEIEFKDDVYVLKENNNDITSLIEKPLVYAYISDSLKTDDVITIEKSLESLQENYSSLVKIYTLSLYENVGLSIETIQSNYILSAGLKMLMVAAIGVVVQLTSTYLSTKTASKIAAQMRRDVFEKVESFS